MRKSLDNSRPTLELPQVTPSATEISYSHQALPQFQNHEQNKCALFKATELYSNCYAALATGTSCWNNWRSPGVGKMGQHDLAQFQGCTVMATIIINNKGLPAREQFSPRASGTHKHYLEFSVPFPLSRKATQALIIVPLGTLFIQWFHEFQRGCGLNLPVFTLPPCPLQNWLNYHFEKSPPALPPSSPGIFYLYPSELSPLCELFH